MTHTKQHCSTADQLLVFLRGQLNAREEAELQQHLDDCPSCRERLESTAADASVWNEAKEFFGNGALHASTRGASDEHEETHQGSQRIRQVLNSLGPTDDPESFGRIGGYEVTGVVGAGGMGVVLKAHDRSLDRIVAIKVMAPHLASSGSARKRFAREAKAAAAVLHPNVIAIHSVASEDATPYLVMPFVRGASLQKRIDSQGPLPLKDVLRIGSQVAAGLAAAHEQGLVHRDIKPANILLEEGVERVTITDFGLARAVDDASMTCSGVIAGTPQYMSPEQARGEPIDARSDLFSLGSVLYAMCTGRAPFRAETTYGVLHRIANDQPSLVREVNPDVPEWLCAIVSKLMTKNPCDRFANAKEVVDLLNHCLAHVQNPSAVELPDSVRDSTNRLYQVRKSKLFGAFAMCCFLIASLLLIAQIVVPPSKNTNEGGQDELPQKPTITQQSNSDSEYHIAGKCVDEDDKPIENAVIELYEGEHIKFKPVKTDANGAFDLGMIPDPELSTTGYVSYVVVGRAPGKAIGAALPFGYSGKPNDLRVVLNAPGQIKGIVTGPDGEPVSGARVSTAGIPWIDGVNGTVTNEAGEYVLDSIPLLKHPGLIRSRGPGVPKEGVMVPIEQRYLIVQHPSFGMLQPGYAECPATVNVNLEQPAILNGLVVDEKGLPIAGVKVSARASQKAVLQSIVGQSPMRGLSSGSSDTNADGEYSIMLQYSGPVEISFSGTKHVAETVNDLSVHSGETVNAPLVTAVEPAYVVGRIVDVDTNKTVACPKGVRLRVYSKGNGPVSTVIVQPDGTYRLPVLPGTNYVYFSIAPDSLQELTKLWDVLDHPNPLTAKQYPVEADKGKEAEVNFPVKVNTEKLGKTTQRLQGDWEIQGATYVASGNARVALTADSLLDGEKRPLRFTVHGNQWLGHSEDMCGARESVLACFLGSGVSELMIDESSLDSQFTLTRFVDGEKLLYPCLFKLNGDQLELLSNASATNDRRQESWELANEAYIVVAKRLSTGTGTLGSKQTANGKDATKQLPLGAIAFGGQVVKAKYKSPGRIQTTVLANGDLAYEVAEIQLLANARIHLCKVTPASKSSERDQVEVIQTMSINARGRFADFVPPEFTSLFERDPSAPYLALVVESEGCVSESLTAPREHWNHDMNFGLEPNEKPVRGQILVNGKPASSVNVSVIGVQRANPDELDALLKREGLSPIDAKEPRKQAFHDGLDPQPSGLMNTNGVLSVEHRATDSQGKFELRGFGPNDVLTLEIEGQGVEKTWLRVINRDIERINLRHGTGHIETYYGCGFTYDQTQVDAHIDPAANHGTQTSAAMAKELDADARQAMSTHQNRLVWTNRFKFDSIRRYTHKEVGRVEERSTLASDGKRFVHRHESLKIDQPADFVGRSLTSFGLYTGDSFMGGTCLTGQPMETGGYSRQNAEEHAWGMRERTSMMLEGYRAGNAGQTILELLLKSKDLEVKKEKIGEIDCFRIKNRDEWGTHVAWIEAKGKNRLLQWESRKSRGNKFSRSRQGEHRDTSNYESSGVRITGIEYREIDGTPIAIRGTYVCFDTPNGGQETVSSMEIERTNIKLKPDFSSDSIFDPLYAEGARITDLDGTDPDKHFWWRNGQLVASDSVNSNQPSTSNKPRPLSTAIGQFNELHNARLLASNTPLLTEDEVRAALWWHANQVDLSPDARRSLLEIVQTRMLPAGWSLQLDSVQWDDEKLWHNKPATSKAVEIKLLNAEQIAVKIRSQFTSSGLASKDRPDSQLLAAIAEFNKTKAENQPPLTLNETMAALSELWRKDPKTGKNFLNLSETATRKLMGVADMHVMDGVRIESSYVNHEVGDSKSLSWRIEFSVDPVKEMVAAEKLIIRERFINHPER